MMKRGGGGGCEIKMFEDSKTILSWLITQVVPYVGGFHTDREACPEKQAEGEKENLDNSTGETCIGVEQLNQALTARIRLCNSLCSIKKRWWNSYHYYYQQLYTVIESPPMKCHWDAFSFHVFSFIQVKVSLKWKISLSTETWSGGQQKWKQI